MEWNQVELTPILRDSHVESIHVSTYLHTPRKHTHLDFHKEGLQGKQIGEYTFITSPFKFLRWLQNLEQTQARLPK